MKPDKPLKGRGAASNTTSRYVEYAREAVDDGWAHEAAESPRLPTRVFIDTARKVISYNQSPDVPFDRSINPYKGCEHGCAYCFARPTHAWLDLSPGLDFETRIFAKPDAQALLARELAQPGYQPQPIALGINTDAYQPIERRLRLTRALLEVLQAHAHPLSIVTKSALIERDIDILGAMAGAGLVEVMISVTSLDQQLSRRMEPRAASPARRLQTIRALRAAGIPVGVLFAPVIPALNDSELEAVLAAVADAGATTAGYVLLRLPLEVRDLFVTWLQEHYPLKAGHVMNIMRELRGGKEYSAVFGERMTGTGEFASLIRQRFRLACRKHGLNRDAVTLDCSRFRVPEQSGDQLTLFE